MASTSGNSGGNGNGLRVVQSKPRPYCPLLRTRRTDLSSTFPQRIFVGGLPVSTTAAELTSFFLPYGPIKDVKIFAGQNNRAYGFVTFESAETTNILLKKREPLIFKSLRVNVAPAFRKPLNRPQGDGFSRSSTGAHSGRHPPNTQSAPALITLANPLNAMASPAAFPPAVTNTSPLYYPSFPEATTYYECLNGTFSTNPALMYSPSDSGTAGSSGTPMFSTPASGCDASGYMTADASLCGNSGPVAQGSSTTATSPVAPGHSFVAMPMMVPVLYCLPSPHMGFPLIPTLGATSATAATTDSSVPTYTGGAALMAFSAAAAAAGHSSMNYPVELLMEGPTSSSTPWRTPTMVSPYGRTHCTDYDVVPRRSSDYGSDYLNRAYQDMEHEFTELKVGEFGCTPRVSPPRAIFVPPRLSLATGENGPRGLPNGKH